MSKKQLKFTATDQVLARTDALKVVGDTIGQYEAAFTLSEWWDGYTATAQFTKNGETIDVLIVDGVCDVPDESVAGNGNMYVNVVSYDGDGNRKTANSVAVPIYASGLKTESAIHAGPTISIWNVIVTLLKFLTGGLTGQVLRKKSGSDYDAEWATPPIDFSETYYTAGEVDDALSGYYTKTAADNLLGGYYTKTAADNLLAGKLKIYTQESDIPTASSALVGQLFTWGSASSLLFPIEVEPGYIYVCAPKEGGGYYWKNVSKEIMTNYLALKENASNKVTSLSSGSTDTQYPSAKIVYTSLAGKQSKSLSFDDTVVAVEDWESDITYADYPYKAAVALTGVTAAMVPHVYFSGANAISGNLVPPPESYAGGVYIFGKVNAEITIPLIVMEVLS